MEVDTGQYVIWVILSLVYLSYGSQNCMELVVAGNPPDLHYYSISDLWWVAKRFLQMEMLKTRKVESFLQI